MAVLRFPDTNERIEREADIRSTLAGMGIDYERWSLDRVPPDSSADAVLAAYADEIDEMKRRGGYVTADVIDVNPTTPNLEAMLARFDKEHTHDEDEVRFILAGRGIFFLHIDERVASVEVGPGRHAARAARHHALVHAVRRPPYPRHSLVSGHLGLDAALHRFGRGQGLSAAVLRAGVPGRARRDAIDTRSKRMSATRTLPARCRRHGCAYFAGDRAAVSLCPHALRGISREEHGRTRACVRTSFCSPKRTASKTGRAFRACHW